MNLSANFIVYLQKEIDLLALASPSISDYISDYFFDAGLTNPLKRFHYISWSRKVLSAVSSCLPPETSLSVVDYGCGCGNFSLYALFLGHNVHAVDVDLAALRILEIRFQLMKCLFPDHHFGSLTICHGPADQFTFENVHLSMFIFSLIMMPTSDAILHSAVKSSVHTLIATGNQRGFLTRFVKRRTIGSVSQLDLNSSLSSFRISKFEFKVALSSLFVLPYYLIFLVPVASLFVPVGRSTALLYHIVNHYSDS